MAYVPGDQHQRSRPPDRAKSLNRDCQKRDTISDTRGDYARPQFQRGLLDPSNAVPGGGLNCFEDLRYEVAYAIRGGANGVLFI